MTRRGRLLDEGDRAENSRSICRNGGSLGTQLRACATARTTVISYTAEWIPGSYGPLAADAQFTTGAGFIDITLTNDLAANAIPAGAGRNLQ